MHNVPFYNKDSEYVEVSDSTTICKRLSPDLLVETYYVVRFLLSFLKNWGSDILRRPKKFEKKIWFHPSNVFDSSVEIVEDNPWIKTQVRTLGLGYINITLEAARSWPIGTKKVKFGLNFCFMKDPF